MFGDCLAQVKAGRPLVHSLTNYVAANDCANILLACGASPIMADDPAEVAEVTSICSALSINLGVLSSCTIESMLRAGKRAGALHIPVVLDPVGVRVSRLRMDTAKRLLAAIPLAVIRGNLTEIKYLAAISGKGSPESKPETACGVDADRGDEISPDRLDDLIDLLRDFAKQTEAVIAVSGAIDLVVSSTDCFCIYNGHPMMAKVTGTGCQLGALTAAFVAKNPDRPAVATAAATAMMGLAGEIAQARLAPTEGNASYRNRLIDAVFCMTPEELDRSARYERR